MIIFHQHFVSFLFLILAGHQCREITEDRLRSNCSRMSFLHPLSTLADQIYVQSTTNCSAEDLTLVKALCPQWHEYEPVGQMVSGKSDLSQPSSVRVLRPARVIRSKNPVFTPGRVWVYSVPWTWAYPVHCTWIYLGMEPGTYPVPWEWVYPLHGTLVYPVHWTWVYLVPCV